MRSEDVFLEAQETFKKPDNSSLFQTQSIQDKFQKWNAGCLSELESTSKPFQVSHYILQSLGCFSNWQHRLNLEMGWKS